MSQTLSQPPARARTGGRSARVVRDVLAAALELFAERGYSGLAIDDVAARAGVNKTTVYRRWPTKVDLLGAALVNLRAQQPPPPDSGSLRDDLVELLFERATLMATPQRRAIMQAMLIGNADPELQTLIQRLRREQPAIARVVFERAVARGELPPHADQALITETLLGVLHSRAVWKRERITRQFLTRLVGLVVAGAAAAPAYSGDRLDGPRDSQSPAG
ncbi:MAG: TetR/AcrR family transcriptional regulator [Polyangiaceae bacterium]